MTTDAPPEKMTNAELVKRLKRLTGQFQLDSSNEILREAGRRLSAPAGDRPPREPTPAMVDAGAVAMPMNDYESHSMHEVSLRARELIKAEWRAMWDAAPDLSAPTPAAPRVGDDGLARLPTQAMYKAAMEAAMGGDGGTDDIVNAAWNAMQGIEQDRSMPPHPLSAPPAASADEQQIMWDDMASDLETIANTTPGLSDWRAERLHDIARYLGYRKRAAQGVRDPQLKELFRAMEFFSDPAGFKGTIPCGGAYQTNGDEGIQQIARDWANYIRRLSALPKGQEHEG